MRARVLLAAASVAMMSSSLFVASNAFAYCRTTTCDLTSGADCKQDSDGCAHAGVDISWTKLPIEYRFAQSSTKLDEDASRAAIREAFHTWENTQCPNGQTSLRFKESSAIDASAPDSSKPPSENFAIFFRDNDWPHDDKDEVLAKTTQDFGVDKGKISYAMIEINTYQAQFSFNGEAGNDLQSVITHEVGHYIGLAHSPFTTAMMASRYCADEDRCSSLDKNRALSDDDINAVCDLYPAPSIAAAGAAARTGAYMPDPGCDVSPSSSPSSRGLSRAPLLAVSFVTLALAILRRRSRR